MPRACSDRPFRFATLRMRGALTLPLRDKNRSQNKKKASATVLGGGGWWWWWWESTQNHFFSEGEGCLANSAGNDTTRQSSYAAPSILGSPVLSAAAPALPLAEEFARRSGWILGGEQHLEIQSRNCIFDATLLPFSTSPISFSHFGRFEISRVKFHADDPLFSYSLNSLAMRLQILDLNG